MYSRKCIMRVVCLKGVVRRKKKISKFFIFDRAYEDI